MPDWSASMQQSFEYYIVDPGTWKESKRLDNVVSCSITRDLSVETLGSATIDVTNSVGECYIRAYLVTIQNGLRERHPLGTFLVQTPSSSLMARFETFLWTLTRHCLNSRRIRHLLDTRYSRVRTSWRKRIR